jgi:type IV secretion system protein TrbL
MKAPAVFNRCLSMALFLCLAGFSSQAYAEINSTGILDNVLARYSEAASAWATIVMARATWLFWTLAVISMVWTFGMMAMRQADLGEFFAEFFRFTMFTGFFWWLLFNGPKFAISIMDSLRQIGAQATGLGNTLAPSGIVDIGFDIFFRVIDKSSVWSPIDAACGILISVAILIVFALVGVNMLLLLISSWVLAYAGVFFLGFGGSRWTSEMAIGYFRTVLNIAAQLLAMILLVGIGKSIVDQYYASMAAGISIKELGVMLVVAAVLLALVKTIPGLIGGLAGGNTGSLGSGFGAGAAVGAAAMGAAALSTAGAAVIAGSAGMAGGAQALMAAFSKANAPENTGGDDLSTGTTTAERQHGGAGFSSDLDSGSGLAAAMGDSGACASGKESAMPAGDVGTQHTKNFAGQVDHKKKGNEKGLASPKLANAGQVVTAAVSNLAMGARAVAKGKMDSIRQSAADRVGESLGGKIAAAINASAGLRQVNDEHAKFDADSIAAGNDSVDAESEVAAFRDGQARHP